MTKNSPFKTTIAGIDFYDYDAGRQLGIRINGSFVGIANLEQLEAIRELLGRFIASQQFKSREHLENRPPYQVVDFTADEWEMLANGLEYSAEESEDIARKNDPLILRCRKMAARLRGGARVV